MIVLLGDSCAGKSSIERLLQLERIISYSTRPIRANEVDHIDYHFITEEEFSNKLMKGGFAESTTYNGWHYAIAKEDCKDNSIVVVEPNGFRQLKRNPDLNIISFYIKVPERSRVIRMMLRGDNIMESFRRIISDQGSFNGIENEVDYIIDNFDGRLNQAVKTIEKILSKAT